jgi:hypothetical protein
MRPSPLAVFLSIVALAAFGCGARTLDTPSDHGAAGTPGGDAGDAASSTSAGDDAAASAPPPGNPSCGDAGVRLIRASDYDQTCARDSDCVAISEGNACNPLSCAWTCARGAVNRHALARYQADVVSLHAEAGAGGALDCTNPSNAASCGALESQVCHCPNEVAACCRSGRCAADLSCVESSP